MLMQESALYSNLAAVFQYTVEPHQYDHSQVMKLY